MKLKLAWKRLGDTVHVRLAISFGGSPFRWCGDASITSEVWDEYRRRHRDVADIEFIEEEYIGQYKVGVGGE